MKGLVFGIFNVIPALESEFTASKLFAVIDNFILIVWHLSNNFSLYLKLNGHKVLNCKLGITLRVSVTSATIFTAKRTMHKNT